MSLLRDAWALDLGSATTRLMDAHGQLILQDITAIAYQNGKPAAMGEEAIRLAQHDPGQIRLVRPVVSGAVAETAETCDLLRLIFRKAKKHPLRLTGWVLTTVSDCVTPVQRKALAQVLREAGASDVWLEDAGWAAALGAGLPTASAGGHMVVDIGAEVVTAAVYSLDGCVGHAAGVKGSRLADESIIRYAREKYHCAMTQENACELKCQLASVWEPAINHTMPVRGRDMENGLPITLQLAAHEMDAALGNWLQELCDLIGQAFAQISPELAADVMKDGLILTGGGARLRGLDKRLELMLGVPAKLAENAELANVRGASALLQRGLPNLQRKAGLRSGRE